MADQELLLTFLQFVALAAPALAILMQVLVNRDGPHSTSVRIVALGFIFLVAGGTLIGSQIILNIEDRITQVSAIIILSSLVAAGIGMIWAIIPQTETITADIEDLSDIFNAAYNLITLTLLMLIPYLIILLPIYYATDYLDENIAFGLIQPSHLISPSISFGIIGFAMAARINIYVFNVGYIPRYQYKEGFNDVLAMAFAIPVVVVLFSSPAFLLALLIDLVVNAYTGISFEHWVYTFPYLWAGIIVFALYGSDISDEEEAK